MAANSLTPMAKAPEASQKVITPRLWLRGAAVSSVMEGASVMGLIETYRRTLETTEIEARLTALEKTK